MFSSSIITAPFESLFASGSSLNFVLENAKDDIFTEIDATQLRQFIIDARSNVISPSTGVITPGKNSFISFKYPPLPLHPRWIVFGSLLRQKSWQYTLNLLIVLNNQHSFNYTFGTDPTMLYIFRCSWHMLHWRHWIFEDKIDRLLWSLLVTPVLWHR